MKRFVSAFLSVALIVCIVPLNRIYSSAITPDEYGFVDVEGTSIEYAVYGKDNKQALVLLSGNGSDMHGLDGNILPFMIDRYKVITISTRGTGNTKLGDSDLTFELEARDLADVLDYLNVESAYLYGFSDGANLAIVFSLLYPNYVTKLCIQSPNINIFGTKLKKQLQIMWQYFILCIECLYKTDPDFVRQREIKGMMAHQPNLTFSDLKEIKAPTLHIYAQNDMMYRSHCERISASIPDCTSLMIGNSNHTSSFEHTADIIAPALLQFYS